MLPGCAHRPSPAQRGRQKWRTVGIAPKRVVLIGAGIVGASLACHLVRLGARLTVAEAGEIACGVTSMSFAWINTSCAGQDPTALLQGGAIDADLVVLAAGSGITVLREKFNLALPVRCVSRHFHALRCAAWPDTQHHFQPRNGSKTGGRRRLARRARLYRR